MVGERSYVILLSGSPLSESLDWSERSLENSLLPAFVDGPDANSAPESTDITPAWRSLSLVAAHLPTGLTQASIEKSQFGSSHGHAAASVSTGREAGFLIATDGAQWSQGSANTESTAPQSQVLSQYYEQSFAAHEDLQSSQIVEAESVDEMSFLTTSGASSFESEISDFHSQKHLVDARLHSGHISELNEIPNAAHLNSIIPQTMTINIVVGIISISQPRKITTRKGARIIELIEMLVGDDTRAGFGINIWMPPAQAQYSKTSRVGKINTLRDEILRLRPRDVILARRVALSSFRSNVYGQSLRQGLTTLDLLYRNVIDAEDARGAFKAREIDANVQGSGQLAKVKKVKDWVAQFVGSGSATEASRRKKRTKIHIEKANLPSLPLDTQ